MSNPDEREVIRGVLRDAVAVNEDELHRICVAVTAAIAFCSEPETWPVFIRFFADSYRKAGEEEAARKIETLTRDRFHGLIPLIISQFDPEGLIDLIHSEIAKEMRSVPSDVDPDPYVDRPLLLLLLSGPEGTALSPPLRRKSGEVYGTAHVSGTSAYRCNPGRREEERCRS